MNEHLRFVTDTRLVALAVALSAALAHPGCTTIFPDRDGDATSSVVTPIPDNGIVDPGYKAQFGQACQQASSLAVDNCAAPDHCVLLSQPLQVTMCTHSCKTDAECSADARCTETPSDRVCVPLCQLDADCQGRISQLRCIQLNEAQGVCWTTDAASGEVKAQAEPVIERLELSRCTGGACQPGLPGPGTDVQAHIYIGNTGIRDLSQLSATVIPKSGVIKNLEGSIGSVQGLFGNSTGVLAVQPKFTIAPEVTPGTKIDFTLRLVSQANDIWERPFSIMAFGSPATMWVTDVDLTESGTVVTEVTPGAQVAVLLSASNLGFGDAYQVSTTAVLANGGAVLTPGQPIVSDFPDNSKSGTPTVPQPVYQGTLAMNPDAKVSVEIDLEMTDLTGARWTQTLSIPVKGP